MVAVLFSGEFGLCCAEDISVGPIKEGRDRMGIAWLRCSAEVAERVAERGRLKVGWL